MKHFSLFRKHHKKFSSRFISILVVVGVLCGLAVYASSAIDTKISEIWTRIVSIETRETRTDAWKKAYYGTLKDVYLGVVSGLTEKINTSGTGKVICPIYTPPNPPPGCHYETTTGANGCIVGELVCTGSGNVYTAHSRKVCEQTVFEGNNRTQNFRWYDSDNKPNDLIIKCSQPKRNNGGLICSEAANGCCPTGQVAINGTCITPANVGEYCYATSGCKDGLKCNNSSNKCETSTTGTGGTGGGTGGTGTGGSTGTIVPVAPAGYTDISCTPGVNGTYWPCANGSSIAVYNPARCGVETSEMFKDESFYSGAQICIGGTTQSTLSINKTSGIVTWFCVNSTDKTSVQCKSKLNLNASCGTATGQSAPIDAANYFTSSNTTLCKTGKLGVMTPGGIGGTGIWKIENTSGNDTNSAAYYANANYAYKCDGEGAGNGVVCKTGKIKADGQCGTSALTCNGGFLNLSKGTVFDSNGIAIKTYETDIYDSKVYWDGEYNWTCDSIGGGASVECKAPNGDRTGYCGTYNGTSRESIRGNYSISINKTNKSVQINSNCTGTYPTGVTCSSVDYTVPNLCTIPTGFGGDPTKLLTIVDGVGTDGTFNWKCASMDKVGNPISPVADCSATKINPGKCGSSNGATLSSLDSSSSFYQSWGAPIVQKYCANGYPNYTDEVGSDGTFNWYCYVQGAQNVDCSATKSSTPAQDPVIDSLSASPSPATAGSDVTISWSTTNVKSNGCELRSSNSQGTLSSLTGQVPSGSVTQKAPSTGPVTLSLTCYNTAGKSVNKTATYNVSGGTNTYTYKWSDISQASWSVCTGVCGSSGTRTRSSQCIRSDGTVLAPGNSDELGGKCTGSQPTETDTTCAPVPGYCTPAKCPASYLDRNSPDGSNSCHFTWTQDITGGGAQTVITLSDGSYAKGYCSTSGVWGTWDVNCKNKTPSVVTCDGGGRTFKSADSSNSCYAQYDQRQAGQSVIIGSGLTITSNGAAASGNAMCQNDGSWTYAIKCPNLNTVSCDQGSFTLTGVVSGNVVTCRINYPSKTAGETISVTGENGLGSAQGTCGSSGAWIDVTYSCP